jgi:BirA family biotin operon repressor/biotin-[acetyl-CoA-carboxylase] ligase
MRDPDAAAGVAVPLDVWEGRTAVELAAEWGLPRVILLTDVGSTNDFAKAIAAEGAGAGTVVLAEQQAAGRGRAGRRWVSSPGLGLYLSFVARPRPAALPPLPLRVALAVARSLDRFVAESVRIKWPNDLLLGDRKFGGILCEASWSGPSVSNAVIGIGLNVLHTPGDFPPELRETAASMVSAGDDVSRRDVASAVAHAMAGLLFGVAVPDGLLSRDEVSELDTRHLLTGRGVEILEPETGRLVVSGRVEGIAPDGTLGVREGDIIHEIRTGTLRPVAQV